MAGMSSHCRLAERSRLTTGTRNVELDFNAVQRGDGEMCQKLYRVVRTCVEMGDTNPIVSIHDQGAGGNCNVRPTMILGTPNAVGGVRERRKLLLQARHPHTVVTEHVLIRPTPFAHMCRC
jgi:hypothetical protein